MISCVQIPLSSARRSNAVPETPPSIKVNQVRTVTETLEAMRICREAGWAQFVSHRSVETDDTFSPISRSGAGAVS